MSTDFLPISRDDLRRRGWSELDIILITGDAYVDHPSYAVAVIGRVLESGGFRVGVIAQPDWRSANDFLKLGRPRLFVGVTSGNVDSMVANYTANKRPRRTDDYSPGGEAGLRPDRAVIVYANRAREAFGKIPIVLGGIEASLRRLAHHDYWDDRVRRSILVDSKADILVYGMGERQALEIARRLEGGDDVRSLNDIRGTVVIRKDRGFLKDHVEIPSFEEVQADKLKFNEAFRLAYSQQDPFKAKPVVQRHGDRYVIQHPPALPMREEELDRIYELPYARGWHPSYDRRGGVKGFETVRFSIISQRGCCGECSFCSLYFHQGRIVQSRSPESVLREAKALAEREDFRGTITDVGGPTANLYRVSCPRWERSGFCEDKSCLMPEKCKSLRMGYRESLDLYRDLRELPGVKHVFIGSGIRYDVVTDGYLEELCRYHVSGQMKVAPEHMLDKVLALMRKPAFKTYEEFRRTFERVRARLNKKLYLVNYFISAHPGCTLRDALECALYLAKRKMHPEQIQDFIPLPMTLSGCMYHTEVHPFTGERVYVPKTLRERRMHRALIQYRNPDNRKLVVEALRELGAMHAAKRLLSSRKAPSAAVHRELSME